MTAAADIAESLWRSAWAVVPLALLVAAICRWMPCRPVTRHTLWVVVLVSFLAPLAAPFLPLPELLPPGEARLPNGQDASAPTGEPVTVMPVVAEPCGSNRFVIVPSSPVPLELLTLLTNRPHAVPDTADTAVPPSLTTADTAVPPSLTTADTAVPPSTNPLVWHGRVGRESTKADPDAHHSASTRTEDHPALTQHDPAQLAVSATRPPAREDAKAAPPGSTWKAWVAALAGVRDALVKLPTLPAGLWLTGIAGLIAVYVGGAIRFRRRLRRAEPAPRSVQRMVAATARRFELRCAPETIVVDEPISPMVWCGGRVRLVLPTGLWSQLDQVGRQAIVCHELAHLRRRDHWVRWLELLISVVFWWHPLLWWVRRRMHEEADLCCDAWVTWLMPRRRRAYAEALLAAREHIGAGRRLTPAVAIGVTTSGAKRFARRITMVMTQSSRPGISLAGIGLACTLALVGWITTPAWASPLPDDRDVPCKTVVVKAGTAADCCPTPDKGCAGECKVIVAKGDAASGCCPKSGKECEMQCRMLVLGGDVAGEGEKKRGERRVIVKRLGEEGDQGNPFGVFYSMAGGDDEDQTRHFLHQLSRSDDDDLEQRLARLEEAVQQLNRLLGGKSLDIHIPAPPAPPARPAPPAPPKSLTWHTPQGQTFKIGDGAIGIALGAPRASTDKGETVVHAYKLPEGKLKVLTTLMVRQDVPVLVSPKDDCIEVHGTPAQHKIFQAFVDMIHPTGKKSAKGHEALARTYAISLDGTDLSELLESHVSGDALLHKLDGLEHLKAIDVYKDSLGDLGECKIVMPEVKLEVIGELDEQMKERAEELHEHAETLRSGAETEELRRAVRELQREAQRLQKLAEQLREKAEHAEH